ncbi:DUF1971 domain-containing protein [Ahrensia marina]|uniref:DUF1971 domain-containing protein n=1 Tax=Ahrensia marina TaxID=1514904 RepID=UPI0035CF3CD8
MTDLPQNVTPYKTTQAFTPETVPAALLAMHRTKEGVWGRIDVLEGRLTVSRFADDGAPLRQDLLPAGAHAIVAPQEPHAVAFAKAGQFTVTFYKTP